MVRAQPGREQCDRLDARALRPATSDRKAVLVVGLRPSRLRLRPPQAGALLFEAARSSALGALQSPGRPLDVRTLRAMESRFGCDFSRVRIHDDASAAAAAAEVNATAFTVGQHVVFGPGRYAPTTSKGRELLAHELAHTVQQRGAQSNGPSVGAGSELEARAAAAGRDVARDRAVTKPLGTSALAIARRAGPQRR